LLRLNDSKKLSPLERQRLSDSLLAMPDIITAQGWLSAQDVDRLNIHQATLCAMGLALNKLSEMLLHAEHSESLHTNPPVQVLIDGKWPIGGHWLLDRLQTWPQKPVIQGDGKSLVIAAASVIAKHHRDAWMIELAQDFPEYDWAQNKGYGTGKHRQALLTYGMTPYHRKTFVTKFSAIVPTLLCEQRSS
jgi:ribonuclease HII